MIAQVLKVHEEHVYVLTRYGSIYGKIHSNAVEISKMYNIEIDVDDIVLNQDIAKSNIENASIYTQKNHVFFNGFVESVEDDLLFLRLGEDIIMLTVEDAKYCKKYISQFVTIKTHKVNMFDTGLRINQTGQGTTGQGTVLCPDEKQLSDGTN